MSTLIVLISLCMLLMGLKFLFSIKSHLLLLLMTLEFLWLVVIFLLVNSLSLFSYDLSLMIYLLIIIVCEAVMGLVLLILMVRTNGSDYIKSMSLIQC